MKQNDTITEAPHVALAELKHINLVDIDVDPNQPRKFFSQSEMDELTESVREKGVVQAITVRPNPCKGKPYMLVCGERRFRASLSVMAAFKSRNTIPASIQDLTDDEALQLQIIENLQRKDVHPMEEAVAFKSLLDKNKDVHEIAARVGKSDFYVRQRVKLNSLTKQWQDAFYAGKINNVQALTLSTFDSATQDAMFKELSSRSVITLDSWIINQYRGELTGAPFDTTDPTLNSKMGACTNCQFNTACASLFPDAANSPKCTKVSCFKSKADASFIKRYEAALADPAVVLVHTQYGKSNEAIVAKAEKAGHQVLNYGEYDIEEAPEPVEDFEKWMEENGDEDEDEKWNRAMWKDEIADYEKELARHRQNIEGGKFKKAFMMTGSEKGKFIFISLSRSGSSKKSSASSTKEKEQEGKLTAADITAEIDRLNEREKRNKQLDLSKIHKGILEQLTKKKKAALALPHQGNTDRAIMIYILIHEISGVYNLKQKSGIKALPSEPAYASKAYQEAYLEALGKITDDELSQLIRTIAFEKWGNPNSVGDIRKEDTVLMWVAKYSDVDIKALQLEQIDIANKRASRVKERIDNLQKQKKELQSKPKKESVAGKGLKELTNKKPIAKKK